MSSKVRGVINTHGVGGMIIHIPPTLCSELKMSPLTPIDISVVNGKLVVEKANTKKREKEDE